VVDLGVVSA
jgi:hypothetical protein